MLLQRGSISFLKKKSKMLPLQCTFCRNKISEMDPHWFMLSVWRDCCPLNFLLYFDQVIPSLYGLMVRHLRDELQCFKLMLIIATLHAIKLD